ncbi:CbrC family protein [Corynebacterium glyciniphilum]|uniref:CbrC family protein n=1 Tax=Corynebacterium glyciniphilum TaxID=1404244 RepID=UPI0005702E33
MITGLYPDFLPGCIVPADLQPGVAYRTPAFLTWQDPQWLACCSVPAQYLGQPTGSELKK